MFENFSRKTSLLFIAAITALMPLYGHLEETSLPLEGIEDTSMRAFKQRDKIINQMVIRLEKFVIDLHEASLSFMLKSNFVPINDTLFDDAISLGNLFAPADSATALLFITELQDFLLSMADLSDSKSSCANLPTNEPAAIVLNEAQIIADLFNQITHANKKEAKELKNLMAKWAQAQIDYLLYAVPLCPARTIPLDIDASNNAYALARALTFTLANVLGEKIAKLEINNAKAFKTSKNNSALVDTIIILENYVVNFHDYTYATLQLFPASYAANNDKRLRDLASAIGIHTFPKDPALAAQLATLINNYTNAGETYVLKVSALGSQNPIPLLPFFNAWVSAADQIALFLSDNGIVKFHSFRKAIVELTELQRTIADDLPVAQTQRSQGISNYVDASNKYTEARILVKNSLAPQLAEKNSKKRR